MIEQVRLRLSSLRMRLALKITFYFMLNLLIIGLIELTTIVSIAAHEGLQEEDLSYTGTYSVTVITRLGDKYYTKIGVEDLSDGKVKVTGNFDGIPLNATGYQTGRTSKTESSYVFKIKVSKLFNGTGRMTIKYQNPNYKLTGFGDGTYNYQGISGYCLGKVSGKRVSTSLPIFGMAAIPAFFGSMFKIALHSGAGIIIILLMIGLLIWHYKRQANQY